jgi:hypothetical protein
LTVRSAPLFQPDGKGTRLLFAQWVRRGAAQPIMAAAVLVEGGLPSTYFRRLWEVAFPSYPPLPKGRIANDDGTASDAFWFVFN